jgi:carbon-monoxide dehydrogenase large subunit
VLTGADLEQRGMAWMPTMSHDTQAVLATDKVRFQGQEVAFVVADDRYSARDALELIDVEYEPLPVVVDARAALDPGAELIRDDLDDGRGNHIFDWESGDRAATERAFARADVVVEQEMRFPRSHPASPSTTASAAS